LIFLPANGLNLIKIASNLSIFLGMPACAPFLCEVLDFAGFFDPTRCDDGAKIVFPENARMTYIVDDPAANAVRPGPSWIEGQLYQPLN